MNFKITNITIIGFIVVLLSMMACANTAPKKEKVPSEQAKVCESWIHPDSMAYSVLGRRVTDITFNPKKVTVYSVAIKDSTNASNVKVEEFFVLDSVVGSLNKQQIAVLDYILLSDGRNYEIDSIKPMIPEYPQIAFEFSNKQGNVIVWYSPDDFSWGIRHDDKTLCKYNVANTRILNRFCSEYVKNIQR